MKKHLFLLTLGATLALSASASAQFTDIKETSAGTIIGRRTDKAIGFHGSAPTAQRSGAAQAAVTDSTGGDTSAATLASTVGVQTVTIPLTSLATGLSTSAIDLLTTFTPGYKFKVLAFDFVTTVVTGGSLNTTLTSTNTIGKVTAGTAVTAANTGTAADTLSIEMAASGTVFTAGAGYFVITIQNMDTADAFAREAALLNELRAALVAKGLIKGGS